MLKEMTITQEDYEVADRLRKEKGSKFSVCGECIVAITLKRELPNIPNDFVVGITGLFLQRVPDYKLGLPTEVRAAINDFDQRMPMAYLPLKFSLNVSENWL